MRLSFAIVATLVLASGAFAQLVENGDMEYQELPAYNGITGWGPSGSWAPHANHDPAGNGWVSELGDNFGYYSAQGSETVGQVSSFVFAADTTYDFDAWVTGGGSDSGEVVFQIGYDLAGEFQLLATNAVTVGATWVEYSGVSYTTGSAGAELGMPIWVRLGDGVDGAPGDSDIWFDNFTLTPEPTSALLLALGALALVRRR